MVLVLVWMGLGYLFFWDFFAGGEGGTVCRLGFVWLREDGEMGM